MLIVLCLGTLARNAPAIAGWILSQNLQTQVAVRDVGLEWPDRVVLHDVIVTEPGFVRGETLFSARDAMFRIDWSRLRSGRLHLEDVRLDRPQVLIKKAQGNWTHALNARAVQPPATQSGNAFAGDGWGRLRIPVSLNEVLFENATVRIVDYDIRLEGFVMQIQDLMGQIRLWEKSGQQKLIGLDFSGKMLHGRDAMPAKMILRGWFRIPRRDANVIARIEDIWLPYYSPYFSRVSSAEIDDGRLSVESKTTVVAGEWETHAKLSLQNLRFGDFEPGGRIFGFQAASLQNILASQSNQMELDLTFNWNMADREESLEKILRRSLRQSVQVSFLESLQRVVAQTLEGIGREGAALFEGPGPAPVIKEDPWEEVIQKIWRVIDR
ncbi:MAG: DUF748 domain-containing protein [Candidatus Omnitrophica bacterium]|nr:DUF748 domain-containing protein [Candidatus Omnitrophota bacterium]